MKSGSRHKSLDKSKQLFAPGESNIVDASWQRHVKIEIITKASCINRGREEPRRIAMEKCSHDTVSRVKSLLHTITMMIVNINVVENSRWSGNERFIKKLAMNQPHYYNNNIIHIIEAMSLACMGVMSLPPPQSINKNVCLVFINRFGNKKEAVPQCSCH